MLPAFTSRIRRAAATFSTSKLDDILSDMRTSIERIADQAQIVEANLSKSERRAAAKARADSSKFQKDVQLEQKAAKEHREAQKAIQARKGVIFQQSPCCLTSELLLRSCRV